MNWLYAALLGLVQGLTEFLPISSSAHLRIVGGFMPGGDPGAAFTAITQLGTELAVIVFFWRDIVKIIKHWFLSLVGKLPRNDPDARLGWWIILGSLPIGVLGLLFQDQIDTTFRSLWIVATMLIVFGILLALADSLGKQRKQLRDMTAGQGLLYGLFQALALIPGVSRSGGTITGGLAMGFTREAAARYSFLLAIPAVVLSGGYKLVKSLDEGFTGPYGLGETAVATLVAFVVGFVIIGWLMKYISTHSFRAFVWYRIALGFLLYLLLGLGLINATA
ncbi:undecaprenyl-diphosphate phosphatase [Galactobacter valiniphilus]|uniref:Undecaprenyl-diphosphatase n=1 Tax=Galactobacter valiniphilus TaxID=2676122 RepID=A0A399JAB8_9MICC|nr:undecaprenyl-diphosphate phosphatase [Galactobacter valiniphilus]RII42164.1 undecaprenyl-diphosphate phosphatase [Galactobacter valiniphilus]